MALYLVQHGRAAPSDIDPERGLTAEGRAEVERIAGVAGGYGVKVAAILHSGKKRARETAEIFSAMLGPGISVTAVSGMDPNDDVISFAAGLSTEDDRMLVGHLPFMERLASYLITGSPDKPVFSFQNGGIVCLDLHRSSRTWAVKWALMPNIC